MYIYVSGETKRVKAKTRPGETVCIVGDVHELGNWDPHLAVSMRRETKKIDGDVDETTCYEECSEDGDMWSKKVRFEGSETFHYRYFICRWFANETEDDLEKLLLVKWWEGHIKPRHFSPTDAMTQNSESELPDPDVFGNYDGIRLINWGWLTDHCELQLQIHSDPIKMWKPRYREQTYSIKCTPIDYRYKEAIDDTYDEEVLGDSMPECTRTDLLVSVLEKGQSKPLPQQKYGTIYRPGSFLTFYAKTLDPEKLGFQFDFFVHDSEGQMPRHVGFSFLLPLDRTKSSGTKHLPITGFKHKPIGEIKFDFLFAKPMIGTSFTMEKTFQRYWKSTRKPVDVGHRGLGSSYKCQKLALVTENTVRSLQQAAQHGADFVEFDVQLTKDEVPVIYHDFKVLITYRKKKREDLEYFEIHVKDLKLSELQSMKLSHTSMETREKYQDIHEDDVDPEDLQPFPTLRRVFETVDPHTGFNVEVKYPLPKIDGSGKIKGYFDINTYVDKILKVVFDHHNGRRIIFSSFDPDIVSVWDMENKSQDFLTGRIRLKQNVYPVLFLTQGDTDRWIPYEGPRARTLKMATEFAISAGLLGVDPVVDLLLKDMSSIKYVKDSSLVLFAWGELCNDKDTIKLLKDNKVDGVIYDRMDTYKSGKKESIFKLEERMKQNMLLRVGSLNLDEVIDSGMESGSAEV